MSSDLPGANLRIQVGSDDLAFDQTVYKEEFLERLRLTFGHPDWITTSRPGIVADSAPSANLTTDVKPLVVSAQGMNVAIRPGLAITKSAHRIALSSSVSKAVKSTDENAINVVTVKYFVTDLTYKAMSLYGSVSARRVLPGWFDPSNESVAAASDVVVIYTLSEWLGLTSEQKDDHVPIALATVLKDSSGNKYLSITMSSTSYTWLRPWFSPVDLEHRLMVGSGTPSSTNPHGQSYNDLTVGPFTLPSLAQACGMVVAGQQSRSHVVGLVTSVSVPSGSIKVDDVSGTVTGVASTKYIELDFYPIKLGAVYGTSSGKEYSFVILPGTNIVYQPSGAYKVPASTDLTVKASKVSTLQPPLKNVSTFTAATISAYDAVMASGKVFVSTATGLTLTDSLADAGPIPIGYYWYLLGTGKVAKNPQVLMCYTKLTDLTAAFTPTITQLGSGPVIIALDKAAAGATLDVKVKVTGTNTSGVVVSETHSFGASWLQGPTIPYGYTYTSKFSRGSAVFASISSIELTSNSNSGSDAAIQVWVAMSTTTSSLLSGACLLAKSQWDGTKLSMVKDRRVVGGSLQWIGHPTQLSSLPYVSFIQEPTATRGAPKLENFRDPQYDCLTPVDRTLVSLVPEDNGERDRNRPDLVGTYESRSIHFEYPLSVVIVTATPIVANDLTDSDVVLLYRYLDGVSGIWSNWGVALPVSAAAWSGLQWEITLSGITTNDIKLMLRGTGVESMLIIPWS